ncbi:mechanosensitive ion channel domain-containing protein [Pseudoxanthomonas sp.]|jgi:small-conductance mechanosensitive channel|uniref:mechanosensitive ion channel domain-containing protein n=1 Tax=Pseudoxanthomonas sp. TaxID=1871049 RepID=UPI00258EE4AD|nr:mechanosensitive ion channel domain-containing protein [Pseudoxanthomonas sp.]
MRVLLALLACLLPFAAPLGYAQDATTLLAPSKPRVSAAIALADIPGRADTDERYAEEVSLRAARADPLGRLVPRLAAIEQSVAQKNGLFAYGELRTLPVVRLESMERHWKFDARQYARWRADMQASVAPYAQDAAELALRRADWELTRRAMSPDSTPAALSARVEAVAARLQQAEQALSSPLAEQIGLGRRANLLAARIETGQRAVEDAIDHADRRLFRLDAPPLWRVQDTGTLRQGVRDSLTRGLQSENSFVAQYAAADVGNQRVLHVLQLLLLPVLLGVAWRHRRRGVDPAAVLATDAELRVIRRPISTWLLLSMIGVLVFEPNAPLFAHQMAMLVALVPVLRLLPQQGRRLLGPWPYLATAFYLLQRLSVLLMASDYLYRLYCLVLAMLALAVTAWLLWRSRGQRFVGKTGRAGQLVHGLGWAAVVVLMVSIGANLLGNVSLAEMLVSATIESGYFALVLYAAVTVFEALLRRLGARKEVRRLWLMRRHGGTLLESFARWARVAAVVGWIAYTMTRFRIFRPVYDTAKAVVTHRFEYGELSISLGHVLVFCIGVVLAVWVARTLRALLREEVLPRMALPRGVDNSVASLSYYVLLLVGLLAALSAAGFKIGQLAFLFGALGVGIGLGLQDVVRNFVSGLILMFERPVKPGDAVDIGGTAGRIRAIGMRATTVRTYDGADVVVPNGMLLSDKVTNWTLVDQNRRVDVDLGVAYGSDVTRVMQLLQETTRTTPGIADDPAPAVLFTGFGASSLDFAIRAWTRRFDDWGTTRSDLMTRLYAALTEAGIEIPFPQQDLHLRTVPGDVLRALAVRGPFPGKDGPEA